MKLNGYSESIKWHLIRIRRNHWYQLELRYLSDLKLYHFNRKECQTIKKSNFPEPNGFNFILRLTREKIQNENFKESPL